MHSSVILLSRAHLFSLTLFGSVFRLFAFLLAACLLSSAIVAPLPQVYALLLFYVFLWIKLKKLVFFMHSCLI